MKSSRTRLAFTLIELLVVIAIISLLVSILIPSLQKAKELARKVACASNLHSIGLAFHYYVNDNDGYLPALTLDQFPSGTWWTNKISVYLPVQHWNNEVWGDIGFNPDEVWTCPSVTKDMVGWCPGYGVAEGQVIRRLNPKPIEEILRPADILMVADCRSSEYGTFKTHPGMFDPPWDDNLPYVWADNNQAARLHMDGSNVCFVGGNTEWRSWDDLNESYDSTFCPDK